MLRRATTHHSQHTHSFALLGNHSIGIIIIVHVTATIIVVVEVFAATAFCGTSEAAETNRAREPTCLYNTNKHIKFRMTLAKKIHIRSS